MKFQQYEDEKFSYKYERKIKRQLSLILEVIALIFALVMAGGIILFIIFVLISEAAEMEKPLVLEIIIGVSIFLNLCIKTAIDIFMEIWNHCLKMNWESIDFQNHGIKITYFNSINSQNLAPSQIIGYQILIKNSMRAGWGGDFIHGNAELTIFGDSKKKLFKGYIHIPKKSNKHQINQSDLEDLFSQKYSAEFMDSRRNILKIFFGLMNLVLIFGFFINMFFIEF